MNDNPYVDWFSMSDRELSGVIGSFVKHHRLSQNKTQTEVCKAAGIGRSTLIQVEKGEAVVLSNLIRVFRVLDLLYIMDVFKVRTEISPIEYAKLQKKNKKQRASSKKPSDNEIEDLGW